MPMPAQMAVVRDGKARLLVDDKPLEIPLERLSEVDQKFVETIRTVIAASAKAAPVTKP
jgi:hypothetical protein